MQYEMTVNGRTIRLTEEQAMKATQGKAIPPEGLTLGAKSTTYDPTTATETTAYIKPIR